MAATDALRQQLVARTDAARRAIIDNMERAGQRASGRTAASLAVASDDDGSRLTVSLLARRFFQGVETGRAGGRVPYNFRGVIRQWAEAKGLTFPTEGAARSFAFLVARKIAREGTALYRAGGRDDIYTPVLRGLMDDAAALVDAFFGAAVQAAFETTKLNDT